MNCPWSTFKALTVTPSSSKITESRANSVTSVAMPARGAMAQERDSRQSIAASPPATTKAMALAQTGMATPSIETCHPRMKRMSCMIAINARKSIASAVNGFIAEPPWEFKGVRRALCSVRASASP